MTMNFNDVTDTITTTSGNLNTSNLVAKGTGQNFILQSNAFSNASWQALQVSLTGSQADPFGGSTATLMTGDGTSNTHGLNCASITLT